MAFGLARRSNTHKQTQNTGLYSQNQKYSSHLYFSDFMALRKASCPPKSWCHDHRAPLSTSGVLVGGLSPYWSHEVGRM